MIRVQLVFRKDGTLREMTVTGHSNLTEAGNDPVCAAVSVLVRTAVRTMETHDGLSIRYKAPEPGIVDVEIAAVPASEAEWLKGVSDMVFRGFRDLERDAPEHINVEEERSNRNGS